MVIVGSSVLLNSSAFSKGPIKAISLNFIIRDSAQLVHSSYMPNLVQPSHVWGLVEQLPFAELGFLLSVEEKFAIYLT